MESTHQDGYFPGLATPELAQRDGADFPTVGTGVSRPAGLSPPTKDNAARLGSKGGAEGQKQVDSADCADRGQPPQPSDNAASAKRAATLGALLAMDGWELRALPNGAHTVSRWGHSRHCTSLDAVAAFAKQVGVRV